ncbi:MAG: hypothetical protein IID46_03150, partial [Planctomycetes bacterium]|nr:hypothetical protein [Planctomycetota bacterium]
MKSKGIVGTTALFMVLVLSQSMLWAQFPDTAMPLDYGVNGEAIDGLYRITDEPSPDPVSGNSFISDDFSSSYEEGTYTSTTDHFGLNGFLNPFDSTSTGRAGLFAGGGVVILEADFDASTAFFIENQTVSPTLTTSQDFNYQHEGAPRIWLGWQDDWGLAFRITWFEFEDRRKESAVAAAEFIFFNGLPSPTIAGGVLLGGSEGDTINAQSSIEYYTFDAEITQELNFDNWQTTFGGGFRHAAVNQRYNANGTAGGVAGSSRIRHRFDGEGPTVFAEVRIPVLGSKDRRFIGSANLSVFAHARGSILFGNAKLNAIDDNPIGSNLDAASLRNHDSLSSGEVRVGFQLDIRPVNGRVIFVR